MLSAIGGWPILRMKLCVSGSGNFTSPVRRAGDPLASLRKMLEGTYFCVLLQFAEL